MDYVRLFLEESKLVFEKIGGQPEGWQELESLLTSKILPPELEVLDEEELKKRVVRAFASCVAFGEVTKELFQHNVEVVVRWLNTLKAGKLKEALESNVDPLLFMTPEECVERIVGRMYGELRKTKEVEAAETEGLVDVLKMLGLNRETRRRLTRSKRNRSKTD